MLEPWDTMSLRTADLGSMFVASGPVWVNSKHLNRATHYPFCTSLCTGELNATRKRKCFSAVMSTEGRVVGPSWEKSKPTGPKREVKETYRTQRIKQEHAGRERQGGPGDDADPPLAGEIFGSGGGFVRGDLIRASIYKYYKCLSIR